jgi:hypothetical protein
MAPRQPHHTLNEFKRTLRDCERLASDADKWSVPGSKPHISRNRAESMIELAYLRGYLAWEVFLEESFVLYSMGLKAPRQRRPPPRYTFPPSRELAKRWLREGRDYAKWDAPAVLLRAERYFQKGEPFQTPLRSRQSTLQEAKTIRNAIAHESDKAWDSFVGLARRESGGALPPNVTVGKFLTAPKQNASPPISVLEYYLDVLERVAEDIVPV